jgi:CBS domain-containing protein
MPSSLPIKPPRKLEDLVAEKSGILKPTDSLSAAGDRMRALHVDMLPVSDGRRLVGMVDECDPDRKAAGHGHDPKEMKIGETMNRDVVYCYEDQDTDEALRTMDGAGMNCLPIVDRSLRIVGMVHRADLVQSSRVQR